MAALSAWVYIFVGGLVSGVSFYINEQKGDGSFTLFFYVGIVFFVIGLAKLLIRVMLGKKTKMPVEPHYAQQRVQPQRKTHQHQAQQARRTHHCRKCGAPLSGYGRFCSKCGYRQR